MSPGVLEFPISEISETENFENLKTENLDFDFDSADYPAGFLPDLADDEGNDQPPDAPASPQGGPAPESVPTTVPEASNAADAKPEAPAVESVPVPEETPATESAFESAPATDSTATDSAVPDYPFALPDFSASLSIPTKGQTLRARIRDLETSILITDREEHSLAERLSSTRKERKELLGLLQSAEQRLKFLIDDGTEHDPDESEAAVANVTGSNTGNRATGSNDYANESPPVSTIVRAAVAATLSTYSGSQSASLPSTFTGDPGATATLSVLGANESQMDKFGEANIRTVCDFERSMRDRSIEKVRGIQERTMDKLKDRLIEWRNKHGYGVSVEATETEATAETATETEVESTPVSVEPVEQPAWITAVPDTATAPDTTTAEATPTPETTDFDTTTTPSVYDLAKQAGRDARVAGLPITANPIKDSEFRASYWEDGWNEADDSVATSDQDASVPVPEQQAPEQLVPAQPKKRGRKPKSEPKATTE
jgi:hypothetical protein